MKKLLSLFVSLALAFSMFSGVNYRVFAEDTSSNGIYNITVGNEEYSFFIPERSDVNVDKDELINNMIDKMHGETDTGKIQEGENGFSTFSNEPPNASPIDVNNKEEIILQLKDHMLQRNTEPIAFSYIPQDGETMNSSEMWDLLIKAYSPEYSTGTKDGDYLRGNFAAASGMVEKIGDTFVMYYFIQYYTNIEQENETDKIVEQVLDELNLSQLSQYKKIKAINDWICDNVRYDYFHVDYEEDGKCHNLYVHSAASGFIDGHTVCSGYALMFYRLCAEAGIKARYITSIPSQNHAWNIVELDGVYYNVDCTWDDGREDKSDKDTCTYIYNYYNLDNMYNTIDNVLQRYSEYNNGKDYTYFLKSDDEFGRHTRNSAYDNDDFYNNYPISTTSYVLCDHSNYRITYPLVKNCINGITEQAQCNECGLRFELENPQTVKYDSHNLITETVDATCENDGYTISKCTNCDYSTKTDVVEKTGHIPNPSKTKTVTPTCYRGGYVQNECSVCKTIYREDYVVPLGHNYEGVVTEPTCTEDGYTTYTCTRCNDTYTDDVKEKLGHSFTNYISDRNATCTKDGTMTAKCDRCDVTDTITDPDVKAGHTYIANVIEPTCTEDGYIRYICAKCYYTETEFDKEKLGHSFTNYTDDHNATCTENGTKTAKCERCDATDSVEIAESSLGHNYKSVVTEPTCTEDGGTTYTCTRCNDTYTDDVKEKLGHSFTNYTDNHNATCTENGTKTAKCDRCDVTDSVEIAESNLGHNYKSVVTEPTCTKDGGTTYTCTRCNDTYTADVKEKLGHSFTNYISDRNATCLNDGTKTAKCDRCDLTRTIPDSGSKLGHNYEDVVIEPSCTTQGYTKHICSRCDYRYSDSYVNRLGHDYVVKVVDPTCTQPGYTVHTCSRCDYCEMDNSTSSLGHSFDEGVVSKAPTCISEGEMKYTCKRCKAIKKEAIAKTEHTRKVTVKKATLSQNGEIVDSCTECSRHFGSTVIPKASSIKLEATTYTYDGKVKKPGVKVTDSKGKTISSSNYTVNYAGGLKNVGKYAVKVTLKGNYSGTKTLYFTIKPKATSISSLSAGSKKFTVKWKKQSTQVTGYQIQYSTSSKFTSPKTVTVSSYKTTSKTISKLKGKKKYYVRVRTYKTVGKTKYYSSWSSAKSITTKK